MFIFHRVSKLISFLGFFGSASVKTCRLIQYQDHEQHEVRAVLVSPQCNFLLILETISKRQIAAIFCKMNPSWLNVTSYVLSTMAKLKLTKGMRWSVHWPMSRSATYPRFRTCTIVIEVGEIFGEVLVMKNEGWSCVGLRFRWLSYISCGSRIWAENQP